MSVVLEYQLISGGFEKEEAINLLTDLFASKIKFHSVSAISYEEINGEKSEFHENRIGELRNERDRMLKQLAQVEENQQILIESKVELKFN